LSSTPSFLQWCLHSFYSYLADAVNALIHGRLNKKIYDFVIWNLNNINSLNHLNLSKTTLIEFTVELEKTETFNRDSFLRKIFFAIQTSLLDIPNFLHFYLIAYVFLGLYLNGEINIESFW